MEGSEPPFFTRFFKWESAKSAVSFSMYTYSLKKSYTFDYYNNSLFMVDAGKLVSKKACNPQKWGSGTRTCK